jgi:spermidine/putrescine transport system permease protein
LWPTLAAPGALWLVLLFVVPLYVVLSVAFGTINPVFESPVPVWNPLQWNPHQFSFVFTHIFGANGIFGPALLRTLVFVLIASSLCLLVAYPVSYYVARLAGRGRGVLLALLIAPFWISYMMRMLAWVNLLQTNGLVNRALSAGGLFSVHVNWLEGRPVVVVLGLFYGYVPYMILPLFAGLDRIPGNMLEASRDLGGSRFETFRRVTLRLSMPAIIASVLLTTLPMLGDYFTNDLLSASPGTSMVGNLINTATETNYLAPEAAAFVVLMMAILIVPMLLYVRGSNRAEGART